MKGNVRSRGGLRKDNRAVSPAISTTILTSAIVVLLIVTIVFANNFLDQRMAENEFSAVKQFMQTVGLQVDDIAWTIGRTQTIRYTSKFGHVNFESVALNYSVYVDKGSGYEWLANYSVGILMFNMPVNKYSLGNNYFERVFPSDDSFLQTGASAPVCHVYVIEKIPMNDGNFIRIVVVPSIRMLNSTILTGGNETNYYKFYLPVLTSGGHPHHSQSVTLFTKSVSVKTENGVKAVKINVIPSKPSLGFNKEFFNFNETEEIINVPEGSVVEFYSSEVIVSIGLHV